MKIAVSIPDPLFDAAERLARQQKVSRSQLYARALKLLLAFQEDDEITARLDLVYGTEDSRLDPGLAAAQVSALGQGW